MTTLLLRITVLSVALIVYLVALNAFLSQGAALLSDPQYKNNKDTTAVLLIYFYYSLCLTFTSEVQVKHLK